MSKTDAMRAMKQARAEAAAASRPASPAAVRPAPAPAPTAGAPTSPAPLARPRAAEQAGRDVADLAPEALCGHQALGGRRCTRPQGHAEKNHRYAA